MPLLLNSPEDIVYYPELRLQDSSISSAVVVPIIVRNELVGVLSISKVDSPGSFELEDLYVLQIFANTAGSCIRHAEQIAWMRHLIPHLGTPIDSDR
jgi:GAF domain-containing protein